MVPLGLAFSKRLQIQPPLDRQTVAGFFCLCMNWKNGRAIVSQVNHHTTKIPREFLMAKLRSARMRIITRTRTARIISTACAHGEHHT